MSMRGTSTTGRLLLAGLLCGMGMVASLAAHSVRAGTSMNVTVNVDTNLGTIPQTAFGANTAVWDGDLTDSVLPGLLQAAGIKVLRFPGGSTADTYHWQTNTQTNGGYTNPNDTFDTFMSVVRQTGAQPVITVNYGSNSAGTGGGDPNEAAAWVQYANVTKGYGVKYWEIGNEVYGNGTYGGAWETDLHTQKGPTAYATNALDFISKMKAVDPSIKIGLVLTAPGNWPDGQTPNWNSAVLSLACSQMDFAVIHWYAQNPGTESDAGLLASTGTIPTMVSTLRAEFAQYCGARANQIQIFVTETNSVSYNPGKQSVSLVNGLFLADNYMNWLEQGASNVDWWDLHNGIVTGTNTSPSLYGSAGYGDYGLFSYGTSSGSISEPPNETPFPAYYGLQMLAHLGAPGDQMVGATSSQNLVAVHAVRQANGNLALLLINKDPSTSYPVSITLNGYTPASSATVYTYGENSTAISTSTVTETGSGFTQTIAPYSLTTLVFQPAAPGANASVTGTPTVTPAAPTDTPAAPVPSSTPLSTATALMATSTPAPPVPASTPGTAGTPAMSFDSSVVLSPVGIASGGTDLIQATVRNTGGLLTNGLVDLEVYNSSGIKVGQQFFAGQTLLPNQAGIYDWQWQVPAQAGTYTVKVGIFAAGWSQMYTWNNGAATLMVTAGTPIVAATSTAIPPTGTATALPPAATSTSVPLTLPPTSTPVIPTAIATSTSVPPTLPPTSTPVIPAATATSTSVPPTLPPTSIPVIPAATATGIPAAPLALGTPSFQITASAPPILIGGARAILHLTIANSGSSLLNGMVDLAIYNAVGRRMAQQSYVGQSLLSGRSTSYSWPWIAPLQAGIYTLKAGVFGPNWTPEYSWNNQVLTLRVY